jgi:hypothetical protein
MAFVLCLTTSALADPAQEMRPTRSATVIAAEAIGWTRDGVEAILLRGGDGQITIRADDATLRADDAVLWIRKEPRSPRRLIDVVLLGGASWRTPEATGEGEALRVNFISDTSPLIRATTRTAADASADPLYLEAAAMRQDELALPQPATQANADQPITEPAAPPPPLAATVLPPEPRVGLQVGELRTLLDDRNNVAVELTGGVFVLRETPEGDLLEARADRGVIFTDVARLADLVGGDDAVRRATGVYLEGDVQVIFTPAEPRGGRGPRNREQRLFARKAYLDPRNLTATLSDAVLHIETGNRRELPLTMRAATLRRLTDGGFEGRGAELSTSRLRNPLLSLNAGRIFVGGPRPSGTRTFGGENLTARSFGIPIFYFPIVRGSTAAGRLPLQSVAISTSDNFGVGLRTRWGLFETFGGTPPEPLDASYGLEYYTERGPRGRLDLAWAGDFLLGGGLAEDAGPQPTTYAGSLRLDGILEKGLDDLPGNRRTLDLNGPRGRFELRHAQRLPMLGGLEDTAADALGLATPPSAGDGDLVVLLRLGGLSDATFLETFDPQRFYEGEPHDARLALARRRGNRLTTAELRLATHAFATVADEVEENTTIERVPEITGGSWGDRIGGLTVSTEARVGLLAFDGLSGEPDLDLGFTSATRRGQPSYGYTGTSERILPRLDLRQEVQMPLDVGPVRVTPFAVARGSFYGDAPSGASQLRGLLGLGVRAATTVARVDDEIFSRILSINRVRHLVEPYVDAFAAAATGEPSDVYIYDAGVDDYRRLVASRVGLRQRWQTYRGPPGAKRSVDFLEVDVSAALFATDDASEGGTAAANVADDFRGIYFATRPESSRPRDTLTASSLWRVSDSTAVVGDAAWALAGPREGDLLVANAGLIVDRGGRLRYDFGGEYIRPLDELSLLGTINYDLTQRYTIAGSARVDIEEGEVRDSAIRVTRFFDRAALDVEFFLDRIGDDSGVRFRFRLTDLPVAALQTP